jgi:hypothetical protein
VCSITHGAILVAADSGLSRRVGTCWLPTAREEAMAPMAAAVAATKNNKQKIRRHLDAVNVGVGFEFLIMEVAGAFGLFDWSVKRKPNPGCRQSGDVCQTFSGKFCILKHEPGGGWTKEKRCLRINFALPARRVREVRDSRKLSELRVRCVFASLLAVAKKIFTEGNSERFRERAKKTKIQFWFLSKKPFVTFVSFC